MEKRTLDPLQIVILVLLTLNLALTGSLWLSRSNPTAVAAKPESSLPAFADSAELDRISGEIQTLYNANDIDGLYELLDDLAQAQLTKTEFQEQLGDVIDLLGNIESVAYSHFEKTKYGQNAVYILHYRVRLSGDVFDKGTLKVTTIDRGDHFKLFGFNIFGGTGP